MTAAERRARRVEAARLRKRGLSWRAIAERLGYASGSSAYNAVFAENGPGAELRVPRYRDGRGRKAAA